MFRQPGDTQYEYSYLVSVREGQSDLKLISEKANRTGQGNPIPLLNESDFSRIAHDWQKANIYSLPEVLNIAEGIVKEVDHPSFSGLLTRVTTQNKSDLSELDDEVILNYFTDSVRSSPGWAAISRLENSRDPIFTILYESSREDWISATVFGNWTVDSVNIMPILIDIELSWNGGMWKFTRMENVRQYKNIYELMLQEPRLYEEIAEQFVFREGTDISPFYM